MHDINAKLAELCSTKQAWMPSSNVRVSSCIANYAIALHASQQCAVKHTFSL